MNKKQILISSLLGSLLFFVTLFSEQLDICTKYSVCSQNSDKLGEIFFVFIPLFILAIFLYKFPAEVYLSWKKFIYLWVPLTMLLVWWAPEYDPSFLMPIEKGTVSFGMSLLFVIISIILISYKYFALKKASTH